MPRGLILKEEARTFFSSVVVTEMGFSSVFVTEMGNIRFKRIVVYTCVFTVFAVEKNAMIIRLIRSHMEALNISEFPTTFLRTKHRD